MSQLITGSGTKTVRFIYEVGVEDEQIEWDDQLGEWRLTAEGKEAAYEQFIDGVTDMGDSSREWYPRYYVLCEEDFMAGQICTLWLGHDGSHQ